MFNNILSKSILLFVLCIVFFSVNVNAYRSSIKYETQQAAERGDRFIENSYFIVFKEPSDFDQGRSAENRRIIHPVKEHQRGKKTVPFGEHSTGQSKQNLAGELSLRGEVIAIFETINAVHVKIDEQEAKRWSKDPRVKFVEQESFHQSATTQTNPGWGLDRMDDATPQFPGGGVGGGDGTYTYTSTGAGQTVYILDSGLNLGIPAVASEFGGRASIIWDANGGSGADCHPTSHGSKVASIAGGNTHGVAKGVTLKIAKITRNCDNLTPTANSVTAFNWLAANAPKGTIVNWSHWSGLPGFSILDPAIIAAHDAGIIVVVAAGNDGKDTANYSPSNLPQAFTVGATTNYLAGTKDAKRSDSRYGSSIDNWAPGVAIRGIDKNGVVENNFGGTSAAAPFTAGLFAVGCAAAGSFCQTIQNATVAYNELKVTGAMGTVVDPDGTPLTGSTSRFIWNQW